MKKLILWAILLACSMSLGSIGKAGDLSDVDFIFPESSERELYAYDFERLGNNLTLDILSLARNEIFARKGYIFQTKELDAYFRGKPWYKPLSNGAVELSDIERFNVELIKYYEYLLQRGRKAYEMGRQALADLNGDGRQDTLLYETDRSTCALTINGVKVEKRGDCFLESFAIVDIDVTDRFKEVVVSDEGPSDDYSSTFYLYNGETIEKIGETQGLFNSGIRLDGHGNLDIRTRGDILQTWFFNVQHYLDDSHHIQLVEGNIYTTHQTLLLKKALQVFAERDENSPTTTLDQYTIVDLVATDNKRWCKVIALDGREGWFYVKRYLHINSAGDPAYQVFYGLSGAD